MNDLDNEDIDENLDNFIEVEPLVDEHGCVRDRRYPGFGEFKELIPILLGKSITLRDAFSIAGYTQHLHDPLLVESVTQYLDDKQHVWFCEELGVWVQNQNRPEPPRSNYKLPIERPVWDQFDENGYKLRENGFEIHENGTVRTEWNQNGNRKS